MIPNIDPLATLPAQVTTYPSPQTNNIEACPAPTPPPTLPLQTELLAMTPERTTTMSVPAHCRSSPSDMLSSPPAVQAPLETPMAEFSVPLNEHSAGSLCGVAGGISPQVPVVSAVCSSPSPLPVGGTEAPMQQLVSHPVPEGLKPEAPQAKASAQQQIPHSSKCHSRLCCKFDSHGITTNL